MTNWTFNAGNQGWSLAWDADGYPGLGCIHGTVVNAVEGSVSGLSLVVNPGDPMSYWVKGSNIYPGGAMQTRLVVRSSGGVVLGEIGTSVSSGGDWTQFTGTVSTSGTVASAYVNINGPGGGEVNEGWFDSIYVAESPPAIGLRLLGMDSDQDNLYVTGIQNGILSLITYDLTTNTPTGTATFGDVSYSDPDSFTRGLWPVVKPSGFGVLYLHGRDASDRQVLYNDTNGTLGWQNVGAGTATWGTSKFCSALMPWVYRGSNVIACFTDDDIYQTLTGTSAWSKLADAPQGIRTATRRNTTAENFLTAGTAAGTLSMTNNLGASFGVAGGTAIAGTINHIELGWWDGNP